MKNPWVIVGVITICLFGGAIWYAGISAEKSNEGVEVSTHVKGNPEAAVSLVEYSDFECPACAAFHPVIKDVLDQYGDDLRFEYKHFPLPIHAHSMDAAVAAEAAGQQGKFFEFHDVLFEKQQEWSTAAVPNSLFIQYAGELGLNVDVFRRHLNSSVLRDAVLANFNESRELGLTGTPSFLLNGERMQFDTYQSFLEQIAVAINPESASSTSSTQNTPAAATVKFGI